MFYQSRRLRFLFLVLSIYWGVFFLFRLAFVFIFYAEAGYVALNELIKSFFIGVRFDLRLAIITVIPILVLSIFPRFNQMRYPILRIVSRWYFLTTLVIFLLFYLINIAHYAYLEKLFEAATFRFLSNPVISLQMIWESYPVIGGILGIAAFLLLLNWIYKTKIQTCLETSPARISRKQAISGGILSVLFFLVGIWGTFSQYALRWSNVYFTQNSFVAACGLNPVLNLYDTYRFADFDFDEKVVRDYYDFMADYLVVTEPDSAQLYFQRLVNFQSSDISTTPNIVIIILESVALNRLGVVGNELNPTPNLDQLITESLFFDRFYVPIVGTARSVFTLLTGIPDVARTKTSSRNPYIREQASIVNAFHEYRKHYILGGSASWAHIRSLILHNIPDIHLTELGDFDSPRMDVWGISDWDLFREAHQIFINDPSDQPFFAVIQTATNHKPYSIPENADGFEVLSPSKQDLTNSGFRSAGQYNAVRLLDYTIGHYFSYAQEADYFKNTLFVLFADHGNSDPAARHMPPADYELKLRSYNVPLIIYGPNFISGGRRISTVSSLPDVLPTIAGITAVPYLNQTLGNDILSWNPEKESFALLVNKKHAYPRIGAIGKDFYLTMFYDGKDVILHELNSQNPVENVKDKFPRITNKYSLAAKALYETSKYLLYNNRNNRDLSPVQGTE